MIVRWYIGFIGVEGQRTKRWHDRFTMPRMRHCFALGYDPVLRVYVMYDPTVRGTAITLFDFHDREVDALILHVKQHGYWLKLNTPDQPGHFPIGKCWLYCVSAVKHLLGIKSCALTPRGLYRDLLKCGAEPAFESETY